MKLGKWWAGAGVQGLSREGQTNVRSPVDSHLLQPLRTGDKQGLSLDPGFQLHTLHPHSLQAHGCSSCFVKSAPSLSCRQPGVTAESWEWPACQSCLSWTQGAVLSPSTEEKESGLCQV